jgi:site-specific DNA recombinase
MPKSPLPPAPTRAAIWCRISADRVGAGLGVARQREDCERLTSERGWSVVGVYEDNDISAYTARHRPGYRALLDAVSAGTVDVVVAWHTDRLHRSPVELEEWIAICDPLGVGVVTARAGELDLSSAAGRMTARIVGAVARHESEQKSERVARKHRELAMAGQPAGGMRAFGHNADGTINEVEATVIRAIVRRVLAGESIKSIVRWLIANKVPTIHGGSWRTSTVTHMLPSARLSGQREWTPRTPPHGPTAAKRPRGYGMGEIVADAVWPAIISKAETAQIRALLGDPARVNRPLGRPVQHLLSGGILRCGRCEKSMNSRSDPATGRRYACIKQPGDTKCGSMSVIADPVEQLVIGMLLDALTGVDLTPQPDDDVDAESVQKMIDSTTDRLKSLAEDYGNELITRGEYLAARQPTELRLREAQARQQLSAKRTALDDIPQDPDEMRTAWDAWALDRQRAVLTAVIDRVIIAPAAYRGRPSFDPNRVSVVWRA